METPRVRLLDGEVEKIYEPSEDSFLLIDALEQDLEIFKSVKPYACLEIGSGSGIVLTALACATARFSPSYFIAVDVNPDACRITRRTGRDNSVDLDVVRMDLTGAIRSKNLFDVIIFNPPYVVTESQEIQSDDALAKAWAGGMRGREVMDRVFPNIPGLLSDSGAFYLVVLRENEPHEITAIFEGFRMIGEIVIERKIRGEHLYVMRFTKTGQNFSKDKT